MKPKHSFILLLVALVLTACGEGPLYEKVYSFDDMKWDQEVKLEYPVKIESVEEEYDFTLFLRTTTDYKYNNLWVFMKTETPDGSIAREPFEIVITNPDGSWVGTKTGTIVETSLYFMRRKLPEVGTYTFTLEQGITESEIDEVLDLGFRVEIAASSGN
ncbi:MAG: gliding motility lipoprotein GldH [Crocinitomicaceae bacterium]|nr:gliding motility lipoprotein GldH [Crocinitomicaceae bacterium]